MDGAGVHRDLPGDGGEVGPPALYDVHCPGLKYLSVIGFNQVIGSDQFLELDIISMNDILLL